MIPIKDDNPTTIFPLMTILLIAANVAVFIYQVTLGEAAQGFVYRFGAVPWEVTHFQEFPNFPGDYQSSIPGVLTIFTSMFLHGGPVHLLGNMLYLWIFGDNIEALVGHFRFLFFYLCCGLVASLGHVISDPQSTLPMVGASGAISGVLGAYFIRFPKARVHVLIIFILFIRVIRVPAIIVLGIWLVIQIMNGLGTLGFGGGGVAWFAHIGGFIAGLILIFFFQKVEPRQSSQTDEWIA